MPCAPSQSARIYYEETGKLVEDLFDIVPGSVNGVLIFMMVLIFVLGFFVEWVEISYIVVPLFLPLLLKLNVDLVWVASPIALNVQTSFLTPPFGWALFDLRGVAPLEVPTLAIYKGVVVNLDFNSAWVCEFARPASGPPRATKVDQSGLRRDVGDPSPSNFGDRGRWST